MRISVPPPSFWLCSHVHRQRSAQHGGHRRTNKTVRAPCAAGVTTPTSENFAIRARGDSRQRLALSVMEILQRSLNETGSNPLSALLLSVEFTLQVCQASALRLAPRSKVQPDETQQESNA